MRIHEVLRPESRSQVGPGFQRTKAVIPNLLIRNDLRDRIWWRRRESKPEKGCFRNPLNSNQIRPKSLPYKNFNESQALSRLITFAHVFVAECSRFAPADMCLSRGLVITLPFAAHHSKRPLRLLSSSYPAMRLSPPVHRARRE
jgi:hypothetical protein